MPADGPKCEAIAKTTGKPCPFNAKAGSKFCGIHSPETRNGPPNEQEVPPEKRQAQRERSVVLAYLEKHRKTIIDLLLGAATDSVVDEVRDAIKDRANMERLIPPETRAEHQAHTEAETIDQISQHWQQHRDHESLARLIGSLRIGMAYQQVERLLGKPDDVTLPRYSASWQGQWDCNRFEPDTCGEQPLVVTFSRAPLEGVVVGYETFCMYG